VADRELPFSYEILVDRETGERRTVEEPLYDILCRRVLSFDEYTRLKALADSLDLAFFTTVMFDEDIDLAVKLGFDSLKIASADLNHLPFIRKAAKTGLSIQLDTGNGTIGEVEEAVEIVRREGNEKIIIHHCPSGYPARLDGINLNVVTTLRQMFPYPIAYSDHSPGWDMDIAALTLGAKLIEKTITEDRTTPSVEHIMSLEPDEMRRFVQTVREIERAFGNSRRIMSAEELEKRKAIRRSAHAKQRIDVGQPVTLDVVEFRRPGFGIAPDIFDQQLCGRKATRVISEGEVLKPNDFSFD
jgi:N,N'-diacetyllegionaminate synthase